MSGEKKPLDPGEEFQKHMQEMLRKANVTFMFGAPQPGPEAAPGKTAEPEEAEAKKSDALRRIREFSLKPREIRDYLDRFVIKQDEAKKILSVAICDHYNHVRRCLKEPDHAERDYSKHNIILLGPTGVGKTYLIRCAAKLIGVPFVKADATKFSETGYVGHDVEDLARDLVKAAEGDTDLAKYGIIYIDEIDKIASAPMAAGRDVSGRGVQVNLLKLMEETEVSLHSQTDLIGQIQAVMEMQRGKSPQRTISSRHMLFIVSGAFDKLSDLVKRRIDASRIGFAHPDQRERTEIDCLRLAQTRDFIQFGFEPEFIGRLPIRCVCENLSADDLVEILLNSEGSILKQYAADFEGYGCNFTVAPEAVREIAKLAEKENTGARGLMTAMERILRNFKFELPSTSIKSFEITAETVAKPDEALRVLLQSSEHDREATMKRDIEGYAARFQADYGCKLSFTTKAVEALVALSAASGKPVRAICEERFVDFQHGLTLIARNTGRATCTVTKKMVDAPGRELSLLIARSFAERAPAGDQ